MRTYIYIEFSKKILSYYFIYLCQILNRPKLGQTKFINLSRLLIYRGSTVYSKFLKINKRKNILRINLNNKCQNT